MNNILIIDDEMSILMALRFALEDQFNVYSTTNPKEGLDLVQAGMIDLVLLDQYLGDIKGVDVLNSIKSINQRTIVIAMTAYGSIKDSIEAIQRGAYYYITKPLDISSLITLIKKALDYQALSDKYEDLTKQFCINLGQSRIISNSSSMNEVLKMIDRVKDLDINVLITGESGTGKELIAKAIHNSSKRKDGPLEIINCAAIPNTLLESELFGFQKGAFTGATTNYKGKFELADKGTILLDEIGDMDIQLQAKLLRVIQEKYVTPIGSEKSIPINFRLIAATNKNLAQEVKKNNFREDLYFRLNVIEIVAPPLRDRKDDIPALTKHFINKYNKIFEKDVTNISRCAILVLENYNYPGNVRELENIIERAVALSTQNTIQIHDLPKDLVSSSNISPSNNIVPIFIGDTIDTAEKKLIISTLEFCEYNKRQTAKILNISERNLYNKLNKYEMNIDEN